MATQPTGGLLAVWTDIAPEAEAEFNEWYNKEHIPQLLDVPGFLTGRRYQAVEGKPRYIALYELSSVDVLKGDAFRQVREMPTEWTKKMRPLFRNTAVAAYEQIFAHGTQPAHLAEYVLTVRLNTPSDKEKEFNKWYNIDHVPALVGVPGVYCAARYRSVDSDPKYLAVYQMNDAGIPKTQAWDKARNSDWTIRIRPSLKDLQAVIAKRIHP
jgi:hypothetical protein